MRTGPVSWDLTANPRLGLPETNLTYTVSITGDAPPEIMAAYLTIGKKRAGPARSEALDSGRVVVDRDASTGEICGIEVTTYVSRPSDLPEWFQAGTVDRMLIAGVALIMFWWERLGVAIVVLHGFQGDLAGLLRQHGLKPWWSEAAPAPPLESASPWRAQLAAVH